MDSMDLLSGRPPTPVASISAATQPRALNSISNESKRGYSPTLFDLVNIYGLIKQSSNSHIPSTFLEAASVDSARQIGAGASFGASLRAIPEGPKIIQTEPIDMGGWSIATSSPAPVRPKAVVFKVAKVAFDKRGRPRQDHEIALQSVLTEFHALLYPPLRKHPNVVDVLDIAWGTNPFHPEQRLPALVLEFADQGTLHDVVRRGDMPSAEKRILCHDVASGLQALHEAGLVHGDVKADNVLLFAGQDRRVAKLGDFGFSVVEDVESNTVWLGGTRPWQAPEVQRAVPLLEAKHTDTYSLGLLVWYMAINGCDPFKRFFTLERPTEEWDQELWEMKAQDGLRNASKTDVWYQLHIAKTLQENPNDPKVVEFGRISRAVSSMAPGILEELMKQMCAELVLQDDLLSVLDKVFEHSLVSEPRKRSLPTIINILRPATASVVTKDAEADITTSTPDAVPLSWKQRGLKNESFSWQNVRTLPPALQRTVFRAISEVENDAYNSSVHFLLCSCLINGYGCAIDVERALKALRTAAELGNIPARAYLYRIHSSLAPEEAPRESLTSYLECYAQCGSLAALAGYKVVEPQKRGVVDRLITDASGGVGANWYDRDEMLHGLTQSDWIGDEFLLAQAQALPNVREYKVNKRGDSLLHFAAACGRHKPLRALIDQYHFDVNCRNNAGDTPLICACRSGHGGNMILLLQIYHADASLAANNGETALHWLVSVNDATVAPATKDLLAYGGNVDAMTKERISHSKFPGTIDADFQMPGTPLDWAVNRNRPEIVRVLLEHGASVYHDNSYEGLGPLNWAAHFHRAHCLQIMIDALEIRYEKAALAKGQTVNKNKAVWYSALLRYAVNSADVFSMILRNGTRYLQDMNETLNLLREKSKLVRPAPDFGGNNQTLFYYAVTQAHDQVVYYMLEHQWHTTDLNRPCGQLLRTPVLEAVRWGRISLVELLIKHGANIHARSSNPYNPERRNWSALHILAAEGQEEDDVVERMLNLGLHVDGQEVPVPAAKGKSISGEADSHNLSERDGTITAVDERTNSQVTSEYQVETPFSCALRSNAFALCDALIAHGASIYATSTSSGLFEVETTTTILGFLIIANSRYSLPRLRYLLRQSPPPTNDRLFIVQPGLGVSALHLAALVPYGVRTTHGTVVMPSDFDFETNREIFHELLSYWRSSEYLDARCELNGKTALTIATERKNLGAIEELSAVGAHRPLAS